MRKSVDKVCAYWLRCQNPKWNKISCVEFLESHIDTLKERLTKYYLDKCQELGVDNITSYTQIDWQSASDAFKNEIMALIFWCSILHIINVRNFEALETVWDIDEDVWDKVRNILNWRTNSSGKINIKRIEEICNELWKEYDTTLFKNIVEEINLLYNVLYPVKIK